MRAANQVSVSQAALLLSASFHVTCTTPSLSLPKVLSHAYAKTLAMQGKISCSKAA